jgi:hypothetical protein
MRVTKFHTHTKQQEENTVLCILIFVFLGIKQDDKICITNIKAAVTCGGVDEI